MYYIKLLLLLSSVILFIIFLPDNECDNLKRITNNKIIMDDLHSWFIKESEKDIDNYLLKVGIDSIHVNDINEFQGIDWKRLNIPREIATIEYFGKNLRYSNFNYDDIDTVAIGYGYRKRLYFKVNGSSSWGIPNMTHIKGDIITQCKERE